MIGRVAGWPGGRVCAGLANCDNHGRDGTGDRDDVDVDQVDK